MKLQKGICLILVLLLTLISPCTFSFTAVATNAGDGKYTWPVSISTPITAGMYYSSGKYHGATDFGCAVGSNIYATASGTVIRVEDRGCLGSHRGNFPPVCPLGNACKAVTLSGSSQGSYGNFIIIDHGNSVYSLYAHLKTDSFKVKEGDYVSQGQIIALSGSSGNSSGPHLHFELRMGSNTSSACVDPQNYLTKANPDPKPIPADDLPDADTFYAKIINTEAWMDLTNDNPNVSSREGTSNSNQYWYFVKNPDESYCIRSTSDGRYLTAAGTSSGSNIQVAEWSGSDSQYWWITGGSDHYVLLPKSSSYVLTLPNASKAEGTNIQLETRATSNNDAQFFQIYTYDDYVMSTNVRTTQGVYAKGSNVTITWSNCFDAVTYWVDIWMAGTDGSAATHIYSLSFSQDSDTYSFTLPSVQNGTYTVYADSDIDGSDSECHFTVADNTLSDTPANLGDDFYAVILTWNAWKPIANDYETDHFVRLQTGEHEKSSAHQLWRFQRQNDGTYVIRSVQDGNCLAFYNVQAGVRQKNDPVSANEAWNNYARQKWWIYESSNGGYFLESYHYSSEGWYMTLPGDNSADGTPITMCNLTRDDNQSWGIYAKSEVQLKAPTLTVNAGTTSEPVHFSWDHVFGAREFQVKIWKDQYDETKAPDYTDTVTSTSSSIQLPAGAYAASVTASNYWQSFTSPIKEFTVDAETYQVYFNGNGATSGGMSNQTFTCDVAQNLTANAFERAYTVTYNYDGATDGNSETSATATATFNGWATTATGAKVYDDEQNVLNLAQSGTVALYANWTLGVITLPTPTKTGYSFEGWFTDPELTNAVGTSFTPDRDCELYAKWEKIVISGDADGDGDICLKDVVQLTRYLSGGWNVTVDMSASDVNKDGKVDLKDVVILQRYLAGGWGVQLA